jgi:hypothetical protein
MMTEGISILCKASFLMAGYAVLEPYAMLNKTEKIKLKWGKETMVPLVPDKPYIISVQWPYVAKKDCSKAVLKVTVKEGEVKRYLYKAGGLSIWSKGKIESI